VRERCGADHTPSEAAQWPENGTIKGVFERFTDRARRVLTLAQEEARSLHHGFIGTEHILLGLIEEGDGLGARALRSLGITTEDVREKVHEIVGVSLSTPGGAPPFTPRSKKVLELALREALQLNHSYIDTEHILFGLVREGNGVATTVLVDLGVDLGSVRRAVDNLMTGGPEVQIGPRAGQPAGGAPRVRPPQEPSCLHCRASLAESARFRTMAIPADSENADPLPVYVVYCVSCGTTLHMLKPDGAS
jgi:ATP-dependent Clp protease ATP-binding subunit ClpA